MFQMKTLFKNINWSWDIYVHWNKLTRGYGCLVETKSFLYAVSKGSWLKFSYSYAGMDLEYDLQSILWKI